MNFIILFLFFIQVLKTSTPIFNTDELKRIVKEKYNLFVSDPLTRRKKIITNSVTNKYDLFVKQPVKKTKDKVIEGGNKIKSGFHSTINFFKDTYNSFLNKIERGIDKLKIKKHENLKNTKDSLILKGSSFISEKRSFEGELFNLIKNFYDNNKNEINNKQIHLTSNNLSKNLIEFKEQLKFIFNKFIFIEQTLHSYLKSNNNPDEKYDKNKINQIIKNIEILKINQPCFLVPLLITIASNKLYEKNKNGLMDNEKNFENIINEIREDFSKNQKPENSKYPVFQSFRNFNGQVIGENRLQGLLFILLKKYSQNNKIKIDQKLEDFIGIIDLYFVSLCYRKAFINTTNGMEFENFTRDLNKSEKSPIFILFNGITVEKGNNVFEGYNREQRERIFENSPQDGRDFNFENNNFKIKTILTGHYMLYIPSEKVYMNTFTSGMYNEFGNLYKGTKNGESSRSTRTNSKYDFISVFRIYPFLAEAINQISLKSDFDF